MCVRGREWVSERECERDPPSAAVRAAPVGERGVAPLGRSERDWEELEARAPLHRESSLLTTYWSESTLSS